MIYKRSIIFVVYFFACLKLFSFSFEQLREDLINFWLPGRLSMYLGIDHNLQDRVMPMLTDNPYDFAVSSAGFFLVFDEKNNQHYLTRNGAFSFDSKNILINEDGYFVIGYNGEYISNNIDAENKGYFPNIFLTVLPVRESINYYTSKYISASEFIVVEDNDVYNKILEHMPISLDLLLDKALPDLENNRGYANIQEIIDLFYQRYNEIKGYALVFSDKVGFEEYCNSLLERIEQFSSYFISDEFAKE